MKHQTFDSKGKLLKEEELPDEVRPTVTPAQAAAKLDAGTAAPEDQQVLIKDLLTRIKKLESK